MIRPYTMHLGKRSVIRHRLVKRAPPMRLGCWAKAGPGPTSGQPGSKPGMTKDLPGDSGIRSSSPGDGPNSDGSRGGSFMGSGGPGGLGLPGKSKSSSGDMNDSGDPNDPDDPDEGPSSATTATTATTQSRPSPSPLAAPRKVGGGSASEPFSKECLDVHNSCRALLRLPPLGWSSTLQGVAQNWANVLTKSNQFMHSEQKYGENLYQSNNGDRSCTKPVMSWFNEWPLYRGEPIGEGNFHGYGHYTQLVWVTTTHVGCAYGDVGARRNTVCEYDPPGNKQGERAPIYSPSGNMIPEEKYCSIQQYDPRRGSTILVQQPSPEGVVTVQSGPTVQQPGAPPAGVVVVQPGPVGPTTSTGAVTQQ
ncbi:hypothetical protein BSLG_001229 [Batrachochytrium salamandrivorans]|nr:hypothetical protein BSLG_001229 [Batrachochytrium salamandrivorans]